VSPPKIKKLRVPPRPPVFAPPPLAPPVPVPPSPYVTMSEEEVSQKAASLPLTLVVPAGIGYRYDGISALSLQQLGEPADRAAAALSDAQIDDPAVHVDAPHQLAVAITLRGHRFECRCTVLGKQRMFMITPRTGDDAADEVNAVVAQTAEKALQIVAHRLDEQQAPGASPDPQACFALNHPLVKRMLRWRSQQVSPEQPVAEPSGGTLSAAADVAHADDDMDDDFDF
ncbi:MAG: hypothetical protein MHM6MM_002307, partial [Cercozoa sp. M6MM]